MEHFVMATSNHMRVQAVVASIIFAGMSLLPVTVAAEASSPKPSENKAATFSANLPKRASQVTTTLTKPGDKVAGHRAEQAKKRPENRTKTDQESATKRAGWDADRLANFTKLEAKATTDAQKAAVATYETAIRAAVTARRNANEQARATFRTGVDSLLDTHDVMLTSQTTTYTFAVSAALDTAKASCLATPKEGVTIHNTLEASLKAARDSFKTARQGNDKVSTQVKQLADARNNSFKANNATFDAASKAARDALKAVLKNA